MTKSLSKTAATVPVGYHRLVRRRVFLLSGAGILVLLACLADIMIGPAMLTMKDVFSALINPSGAGELNHLVVWTFRLPVALFALLAGAALGIAGAEMQTVLDNPLASPYTLGVSAAAGFGAALAIVFFPGALAIPLGAFVFAMFSSMLVWGAGQLRRGSSDTIVLCGIAILFLFNSALAFLQYTASDTQLQAIVFWMFGSLQGATWPKLAVLASVLAITLPLLASQAWKLTALRLGDDRARSLGINVRRLRLQTLILVSALTAVCVCFVGAIGFIGLVAPHIARRFTGEDQRFFLPLSALIGALLLSIASVVSKTLIPGAVFPVGIATSLFGVPFFAVLVLSGRRRTE